MMPWLKKYIPFFAAIVVMLLSWEAISLAIAYPDIFPGIKSLLMQIIIIFAEPGFYSAVGMTILRGIAGFGVSVMLALVLSIAAVFSDFWKSFFYPFIVLFRSIPVISLVLVALIWFSPEFLPVFIAIVTMFPVIYQNMLNGFELTDKKLTEMAKIFGKPALARFVTLYFPTAKPVIFGGISSAMGFGWRAVIIGEVLAQPMRGIGTSMKSAQVFINISELIAWTVVAILISYLFDIGFKKISAFNFSKLFAEPHFKKNVIVKKRTAEIQSIMFENVALSFGNQNVFASYSSSFEAGTVYLLKAASGRGKTTLLRLAAGLKQPDEGKIKRQNLSSFGYSFQDIRLIPWLSARENIFYTIPKHKFDKDIIEDLYQKMIFISELGEHTHKLPNELSGGQQQRVNVIRALMSFPDVLLLDEPLNGLDDEMKKTMVKLVADFVVEYKPLVIWATHENPRLENVTSVTVEI